MMAEPYLIENDLSIYPMLEELRSCLCSALGDGAPCFCGIVVGEDIPVEYAGECGDDNCGAAYVRLANAFPSTAFPEPALEARCFTTMAYTVSVGILRCVSIGDDRGNPPSPDEMRDMALMQLSDMKIIRKAIQCCFGSSFEDVEYVLGQFTPLPMQGGVVGGEWALTIQEHF